MKTFFYKIRLSFLQKKALITSFGLSIFYVGLATVSLLALYPSSPIFGEWSLYTTLLTFPVSFIGFGIAYAEPDNTILLLSVQFLVFLLFWFIVYKISSKNLTERRISEK